MRDFVYALRNLRKTPGFALTAIGTLALGIAANTAIFSVVDGVLLKPFPFPHADRIVFVRETLHGKEWGPASIPDFKDWRQDSRSFESMAVYRFQTGFDLAGHGEPRRIPGTLVSQDFFKVLGVTPERGRLFVPEDFRSTSNLALISSGLWKEAFGADPSIVGGAVKLSGVLYTIVGIVPSRLAFSEGCEVWLPERFDEPEAAIRGSHFLPTIARLKPGATMKQAQSEMNGIAHRLAAAYPADNIARGVLLVPFTDFFIRWVRTSLYVLLACVGFVLLIACANVGNLLLARGASRRQEVAIRSALGASRGALIRQFLTESLVISVMSGAVGLFGVYLGLPALVSWLPAGALPSTTGIAVNAPVFGFTAAVSLLTPLVFGLLPALQATRVDTNRAAIGARSGMFRNALIVAEYALAVVLLIGGGLMIKTFIALRHVDPGFRPDNVAAFELHRLSHNSSEAESRLRTFQNAVERIRHLHGASSVSQAVFLPLGGWNNNGDFRIAGRPIPPAGNAPIAEMRFIAPAFFQTLAIPILQGRDFTDRDDGTAPQVALINQTMARKFWPDQNPIGERFAFQNEQNEWEWRQIVGIAGDVKSFGIAEPLRYEAYIPMAQSLPKTIPPSGFDLTTNIVVRSATRDDASLAPEIRRLIQDVDPDQPIAAVTTLNSLIDRSISSPRFESSLLSAFAGIALLLAAAGLYALISYSVSQRTREIGVRVALGAERGDVIGLVMFQGTRLIAIGAILGVVLSATLSNILRTMLYEVSPLDPAVYATVLALLAAVACAATYIPARRAAAIDPMAALRYE